MQLGQKPTFITQSQHHFNTVLTRAGMAFDSRHYEVTHKQHSGQGLGKL